MLIIALLFSGPAPASEAMPPPVWRSAYGYQKLRWGMTKSDVQKQYPKLVQREGDWDSDGHMVAGYRSTLRFRFSADRLRAVMVYLICHTDDECRACKNAIVAGLKAKYGAATNELGGDPVWWIGGMEPNLYQTAKMLVSVNMVEADEHGPPFVAIDYVSTEVPYRPNVEGL